MTTDIKTGDRITFKVIVGGRSVTGTCIVRGIDDHGRYLVRYNGFDDFIVYPCEVVKVLPQGGDANG
jgi:hypothetical protein